MRLIPSKELIILTIGLSLIPQSGYSETGNSDIPPPADTQPYYSPDPIKPEDRQDANGAAIAAAAIGAATAFTGCAMLMAAARKEQDPSKKAQLLAQAAQQCGQGAANIANMAQNSDGKDAVTSTGPKQAQYAALPTLDNSKNTDSKSGSTNSSSPSENPEPAKEVVNAQTYVPNENMFGTPTSPSAHKNNNPNYAGVSGQSTLDPIKGQTVSYDDNSKGEGKTPQTPMGASTTTSFAKFDDSTFKDAKPVPKDEIDGKDKKERKNLNRHEDHADSGGSGHSGLGSSSDSSGDFDVASLMNKYLGKKQGSESGGVSDIQFVKLPPGKPSSGKTEKMGPHIFQYASYRYQLSEKDGLVSSKGKPRTLAALSKVKLLKH